MVRFWLEVVGENCYIYFVFFIIDLFECGDLCLGLGFVWVWVWVWEMFAWSEGIVRIYSSDKVSRFARVDSR